MKVYSWVGGDRPADTAGHAREELAHHVEGVDVVLDRDFAFPVMQWQAKYEGIYLLGTSIARPLISKVCLQVAREVGAEATDH